MTSSTQSPKATAQPQTPAKARCRACEAPLTQTFVDLGMSPLANSYLAADQLARAEAFYPLHAYVCSECLLVQLQEFESPERIFSDYAYFSSYSDSWLEHARRYVDQITERLGLTADSTVVELASNDGYLLQYFVEKGIPVLGVEPAANVAEAAKQKGIPTLVKFFGQETAAEFVEQGVNADLLIGNNVLAHVPNLTSFVAGMAILLAADGVITMEFPHLLRLMAENQFDTIYHEHFSYFSLLAVRKVFAAHGLTIFDVDELPTHGGSLRIYAGHSGRHPESPKIADVLQHEIQAGLDRLETYKAFHEQVKRTKRNLWQFFIESANDGKRIAAYGAPAKGNTLLNYSGIGKDFIDFTVDRSPAKQGLYLPGTHIPIYAPEMIAQAKPDYLLILPWNLREEIMTQNAFVRDWGGRFVVPIPEPQILP